MNIKEFIGLYTKCGFTINTIAGYHFSNQNGFTFSFPPLVKIPINNIPIKSLKWKYLISIILTDFRIKNTSEFILDTDDYDLEKFARKTRNRIRRSLLNCTFKKPPLEDMIYSGLKINKQTCKRQHRRAKNLTNKKCWSKYIKTIYSYDSFEILGAYYATRLVGYIIAFELEGKYLIQHAYIDKQDAEITAPMNGLIYTLVNKLIKEKGPIKISYGLDSIKDLPDLNRFKLNMLFEKEALTRVYVINPLLLPFIKISICFVFRFLKRKRIRSVFTRELIHIYNGHRLLLKQQSPENRNQK